MIFNKSIWNHPTWRRAVYGVLTCLLLLNPVIAQKTAATQPKQPTAYERAIQLAQQGKQKEAIALFRQVIHSQPNNALAHFNLGVLYRQTDNHKQAEYHFKRAWTLAPNRHEALVELIRVCLETGKMPEADAHFRTLQSRFSKLPELPLIAGSVAMAKGDWKGSYEQFKAAQTRLPKDSRPYYNAGLAAYQLAKYEAALKEFRKVTELSPKDVSAWKAVGMTYEALKMPDKAIESYTRALQIEPEDVPTRLRRGSLNENQKQLEKALVDYNAILKVFPRNTDARLRAGSVYYQLSNYTEALKLFGSVHRQLTKDDQLYFDVLTEISWCEYHLKQYERAQEHFAEVLRHSPKNTRAYEGQMLNLEAQNEDERVVVLCRQWSINQPNDPRPLLKIAEIYDRNRKFDSAKAEYDKLMKNFGDVPGIRQRYADHLRARGLVDEALQQYDTVLTKDPENSNALESKAQILESAGRYDESLAIYRQLNSKAPNDRYELSMAAILVKADRKEDALKLYRQLALRKEPAPLSVGGAVDIYIGEKKVDEAIAFLKECAQTQGEPDGYLSQIAQILMVHNRPDDAIKEYQQAIARNPNSSKLQAEYGFILKSLERYDDALQVIRELQKKEPQRTWCHLQIAQILIQKEQKSEAWDELKAGLQINPDDLALYPPLERLAAELKRETEYETFLQTLAQKETPGQEAAKRHVTHLESKNQDEDALAFLDQRLKNSPNDFILLRLKLGLLERLKRSADALKLYPRIAKQEPPDLFLLRQWGMRAEEIGTPQDCIQAYEALTQANPDDVSSWLKLARFYHQVKQTGKAIDLVRALQADYPDNADVKRALRELEK